MQGSIASITTSYNGIRLLSRHIDALLAQSRMLQEVVIVDNGSSDGTGTFLAERYPQVTVLRLNVNAGTAGGWAAGLSYAAMERKHDWIWSFDNDSVPGPDLLEKMLAGAEALISDETIGMLAPIPVEPETGFRHTPQLIDGSTLPRQRSSPADECMQQPVCFVKAVIASGCLIRRQLVETIGLPRVEFYMDFFDIEYSLRARLAGYKIALITSCEMGHTIGNTRKIRLLGKDRVWVRQPPWREYYSARNLAYAAWWMPQLNIRKAAVWKRIFHRMPRLIMFSDMKFAHLIKMIQGTLDGIRGRLGIRFRPGA